MQDPSTSPLARRALFSEDQTLHLSSPIRTQRNSATSALVTGRSLVSATRSEKHSAAPHVRWAATAPMRAILAASASERLAFNSSRGGWPPSSMQSRGF